MTVTASFLQGASDASNLTTYTFATQNLGTAAGGRYIAVGIGARGTNSGLTISTVTIAGVSATETIQVTNSASSNNVSGIYIAAVPTGTTGDVVVTFSVGVLRCAIQMYRLVGIDSITASDTGTSTALDPTTSIDVPAGGVAIGAANCSNATTATWTGITEDYDSQTEAWTGSSAFNTFASVQTGLTVTCEFVGPSNSAGVFASWGEAATGTTYPQLERELRGVNRGVYTGR